MPSVPAEIVAIAECLNVNLPLRPGDEHFVRPGWAAIVGAQTDPHHNVVQRFRLAPGEEADAVAEIRSIFRERGRTRITWEIGTTSTPADLGERLAPFGIVPFAPEPLLVGMALSEPLSAPAHDLRIERVTTFDEFLTAAHIFHRCFAGHGDPAPVEEDLRKRWAIKSEMGSFGRWIAYAEGQPVAAADAVFLPTAVVMCGGATLPEARGKGCYQALVSTRWEEGRRRGAPTLVTQAGAMSRPILAKLGFEEVAEIRIYLDEFT
jgi:GNAT superfamily N-acetyltransferase